jgi:hypothetical protein
MFLEANQKEYVPDFFFFKLVTLIHLEYRDILFEIGANFNSFILTPFTGLILRAI